MKVSEINLEFVCQYLNIFLDVNDNSPEANLLRLELNSYITFAKQYIADYTQLTEEEIEKREYLVMPILILISDMYENKSMGGENVVNPTFKSLVAIAREVIL